MFIDIIIKPVVTGAFIEESFNVKLNTQNGTDAYNEYFGTEKKKGDMFIVKDIKELRNMIEMSNLISIFG